MGAVVVFVVILSMGISIKFIVVVAGDLSPSIKCVCVRVFIFHLDLLISALGL